jgi:hypothetical protein
VTVAEFDRQAAALVGAGYPALVGSTDARFLRSLEPLRAEAAVRVPEEGRPFVLVVPGVPAAESMPRTGLSGPAGFVSADSTDLDRFAPIAEVAIPQTGPYLLLDVERGDEYANRSPDEAVPEILARGRTPLTVAEGIAFLTLVRGALERNRCFMLAGSRGTDRRVPALWISGGTGKDGRARRGAPKLGWCWAGNRHTWLGHASAGGRVGVGVPVP